MIFTPKSIIFILRTFISYHWYEINESMKAIPSGMNFVLLHSNQYINFIPTLVFFRFYPYMGEGEKWQNVELFHRVIKNVCTIEKRNGTLVSFMYMSIIYIVYFQLRVVPTVEFIIARHVPIILYYALEHFPKFQPILPQLCSRI